MENYLNLRLRFQNWQLLSTDYLKKWQLIIYINKQAYINDQVLRIQLGVLAILLLPLLNNNTLNFPTQLFIKMDVKFLLRICNYLLTYHSFQVQNTMCCLLDCLVVKYFRYRSRHVHLITYDTVIQLFSTFGKLLISHIQVSTSNLFCYKYKCLRPKILHSVLFDCASNRIF